MASDLVNVTDSAPRQTRSRKTTAKTETPKSASPAAAVATKPTEAAVPKPRASRSKAAPKKVAPQTATIAEAAPVVDLRTGTPTAEVSQAEIALNAYLLWEQGQPGDSLAHWLAAESLVRQG